MVHNSSNNDQSQDHGKLVYLNDQDKPSLVVPSKAATTVAKYLKNKYRYDVQSNTWYCFVGTHWETDKYQYRDAICNFIMQETLPLGHRMSHQKDIIEFLTRLDLLRFQNDKHIGCIVPFQNCLVIEHINGQREIKPTTAKNALTYCLPLKYNTDADCPNIIWWLELMAGKDLLQYIRAILSLLVRGKIADEQKFLHLYGTAKTGKSTFIRLLEKLIGRKNCISTSLSQLEGNRFEIANFLNKRLVFIPDSGKYGGSVDTLKSLTGQDIIRFERKHEQSDTSFIFDGLIVIASNEYITSTDRTNGIERRRITVPFNTKINELPEKELKRWQSIKGEYGLEKELDGLVNWLLDLPLAQAQSIVRTPPDAILNENREALFASNPIAYWASERLTPAPSDKHYLLIGTKEQDSGLYSRFVDWCNNNGSRAISSQKFTQALLEVINNTLDIKAYKKRNKHGMAIYGIDWISENHHAEEEEIAALTKENAALREKLAEMEKRFETVETDVSKKYEEVDEGRARQIERLNMKHYEEKEALKARIKELENSTATIEDELPY